MHRICQQTLLALTFLATKMAFAEGVVEWSNLSAAGNGCPAGSAVITATPDGNELSFTADSFGYELKGEGSIQRFCRLSGSAKIAPGYYLDEVFQQISYGGFKSRSGSSLTMGAQARFLGFTLTPLTRDYADGARFNVWQVSPRRRDKFSDLAPPEFFCGQDARSGLFQGTVASNGSVTHPDGKLIVGIQGLTVSYKAGFSWLPCPT
jgi:hypothetical protein